MMMIMMILYIYIYIYIYIHINLFAYCLIDVASLLSSIFSILLARSSRRNAWVLSRRQWAGQRTLPKASFEHRSLCWTYLSLVSVMVWFQFCEKSVRKVMTTVCMWLSACIYIYIYVHMIYIYIYIHVFTHIHIIYIYIFIFTHKYIYIYIYIHAYT